MNAQSPEPAPEPTPEVTRVAKRGVPAWLMVAAALVIGTAAGLAGVYGIGGFSRNGGDIVAPVDAARQSTTVPVDEACRAASEVARRIQPLAKGEVAAFAPTLVPRNMPDLAFEDSEGKTVRFSDLHGRVRLVNLWATWCVPCRKEMPALNELEAKLGGDRFQVVAINLDNRDAQKPRDFLRETKVDRLAFFTDPTSKVFQEMRAVGRGFGLPTTLLVDAKGCEIGFIAGPAEWASPDAVALVEAAMATQ